jgi:hypothetical protein
LVNLIEERDYFVVIVNLRVDHIRYTSKPGRRKQKGLEASNWRRTIPCKCEGHTSRDSAEDVAYETKRAENLAVKRRFVDLTGPLDTSSVPLDKPAMFTGVLGLVEQLHSCFVEAVGCKATVFSKAHQTGMVCFRPYTVSLQERVHDAPALFLTGSWVLGTQPLLEVNARTFIM